MAVSLTLKAAQKGTQALVIAANYVKAVTSIAVDTTELRTGGVAFKQPATIVKALADVAKLGVSGTGAAFNAAQTSQWLQFALSDAATQPSAVTDVDQCLASQSYLAGPALSIADVVSFAALHGAFVGMSPSQQGAKPHFSRWFAQVQAELAAAGVDTALPFVAGPARTFRYSVAKAQATGGDAGAAAPGATEGQGVPAAAAAAASGGAPPAVPAGGDGGKQASGKKEKKSKKEKKKGGGGAKKDSGAAEVEHIAKCEFKVGTITKAWVHPEADTLYCEEIDVGEDAPRQIASGLRNFMPLEKLQGARVLVFTNLKPRPLANFPSNGMVICASAPGKTSVELLTPPEGVPNGEVVTFEGHPAAIEPPNRMAKKKILDKVLPDLALNADGVACWKGVPFMTSGGPITAPTLREGTVG
ncbi:unnamed protein product [Symbiodinium sp. KB8]|nr:unnamed protein product [Symbiodinium sp. KB8]